MLVLGSRRILSLINYLYLTMISRLLPNIGLDYRMLMDYQRSAIVVQG